MRKSRVLLAGAAVAAAAVTTSAFTGGNTLTAASTVVGYGEVVATGINVTSVTYNRLSSDPSILDNVVFQSDEVRDIGTGHVATMYLRGASTVARSCTITGSTGSWTITCGGGGSAYSDFNAVGLSVGAA